MRAARPGGSPPRGGAPLRRRAGITLLEVLLAAGLGLVLVGGMYAALDQSWKMSISGRTELERCQIARAVLRRIELDIRAAMFEPKAASSSSDDASGSTSASSGTNAASSSNSNTSSSSGSGGADSSTSVTTSAAEDEDAWTGSLGIRGNASEIWIDLSHVRRELEFTALPGTSDLQTVSYFLTNSALAASQTQTATTPASPLQLSDSDGVGLGRSQGERSVLRNLNSTSGSTILPGPMQVLAPEIDRLAFRYFDGLTWYEQWDSSSAGALPRAVEVTIGFRPPKNAGALLNAHVAASTASFRAVIVVPASDPLPPEESY